MLFKGLMRKRSTELDITLCTVCTLTLHITVRNLPGKYQSALDNLHNGLLGKLDVNRPEIGDMACTA